MLQQTIYPELKMTKQAMIVKLMITFLEKLLWKSIPKMNLGFYWPTIIKEAYTLVAVDYISKWAEAQALLTNDARVVITFLKKLFCHFKMPKALISDRDLIAAGEKRMFQLHELDELRHQAYEISRLYKARTKLWHDRKLRMRKEFKQGNKDLLFHSKYKFKQPKLRSRKKKKSLDYNNSFLGEYECSSLTLDREEMRDEKEEIGSLETRSNNVSDQEISVKHSGSGSGGWFCTLIVWLGRWSLAGGGGLGVGMVSPLIGGAGRVIRVEFPWVRGGRGMPLTLSRAGLLGVTGCGLGWEWYKWGRVVARAGGLNKLVMLLKALAEVAGAHRGREGFVKGIAPGACRWYWGAAARTGMVGGRGAGWVICGVGVGWGIGVVRCGDFIGGGVGCGELHCRHACIMRLGVLGVWGCSKWAQCPRLGIVFWAGILGVVGETAKAGLGEGLGDSRDEQETIGRSVDRRADAVLRVLVIVQDWHCIGLSVFEYLGSASLLSLVWFVDISSCGSIGGGEWLEHREYAVALGGIVEVDGDGMVVWEEELIFELQNCNTSRVARANVTKLKTLHTADLRKSMILMRMVTETHNKIVDKIEFAVRRREM
ncbi:reverse transcriptase domain-containing protein [Tanacetum coccineum]